MFLTRMVRDVMEMEIPIWQRAFDVREDVYREWCLEFYSSLRVEKEFPAHRMHAEKLITFRLGGREHELTLPQFGMLVGLFTTAEVENTALMSFYIALGEKDSDNFSDDQAWFELTGKDSYSSLSKIKDVKIPILRVIHKLLTYSFVHRSTQQDKVYSEDLWMLHTFSKRDPTQYINVAWTLVCYLELKAMGRTSNSQICCGHFVTRIAKNLGLFTRANTQKCSPAIKWKYLTKHDLDKSGLIHPSGNRLIDAEPLPGTSQQQQPQQRGQRQRQGSMREEIFRMGGMMDRMNFQVDQMGQQMTGMTGYMEYHMNRYQPSMEEMARNSHATSSSSSTTAWFPYAPPPLYYPQPYHQPAQEEGDGDEEEYDD